MEYFIDRRVMPNGKKSIIHLDNAFPLTSHILDTLYLYGLSCAANGLNVQTALASNGTQINCVRLGGTLDSNTTIAGGAFNLTLSGLGTLALSSVSTSVTSSGRTTLFSSLLNLVATSSFNLRTPAVIATTATVGQFLRLNNGASGSAEWTTLPDDKYKEDFTISTWDSQQILIQATTHQRGTYPIVQVNIGSSSYDVILPLGAGTPLISISINASGDVLLLCDVGQEFDGRIIIT